MATINLIIISQVLGAIFFLNVISENAITSRFFALLGIVTSIVAVSLLDKCDCVEKCMLVLNRYSFPIYAQGKGREDYGFKASDFTFQEYRNLVKKALQDKFRTEYVYDGNKSLKIDENTYHVKADVVPSFQLRNYYYENSLDPNKYIEGVWLQAKTGEIVKNYPKRHKANGIAKNNNTSYQYKKLVRIMKHIKNEMVEDKKTDGDKITSFLVECLVYHVPNNVITGYST